MQNRSNIDVYEPSSYVGSSYDESEDLESGYRDESNFSELKVSDQNTPALQREM